MSARRNAPSPPDPGYIPAPNNATPHNDQSRVVLFGCPIDNLSTDEAINRIEGFIQRGGAHRYFAVNVHKIVAFRRYPHLRAMANHSDLVTADGQPILWAARIFGKSLKERVTGIDLMDRLVQVSATKHYSIYLLGAKRDTLECLVQRYKKQFPEIKIAGMQHGYFSKNEEPVVVKAIREARPDILFIGMSSPRKEEFIERYSEELKIPFVMGVGGSFDVLAGTVARSPVWMQRLGLEWLWRIRQEPGRMWKRYLFDAVVFMLIVIRQIFRDRDCLNANS